MKKNGDKLNVPRANLRCVALASRPLTVMTLAAIAVVCAAIPPACAQDDSTGDSPDVIQGTVVNAATGGGIGRALVYSPDQRFATLTDGQGHFQFNVPKPQNSGSGQAEVFGSTTRLISGPSQFPFALAARKPGFIENPQQQTLMAPGANVIIRLLPEAIIKGRVLTSDTDAAEGIMVELFMRQVQDGMPRWRQSFSARANSNGEFRFADLQPGSYKVMTRELLDTDPVDMAPRAQLFGFPPACFPGAPDFSSGQTIQLSAGQIFQADIALNRQPYFRVQLPVSNATEGAGMNVDVLAQGHPGPGYSLGYNADTQKIVGLLPKGNYRIQATLFGPVPSSGSVNLNVGGNITDGPALTMISGAQIPLNVREEFTSTNWSASASFNDQGHSLTFHSGPRVYLNVDLEPVGEFSGQSYGPRMPRSATDNSLVIDGVQPGQYWVRLHAGHGYVASATSGTADLLHEPLEVSGGSTPIDVVVRDDTAILEGTVVGLTDASADTSQPPAAPVYANGEASPIAVSPAAYIYCVPLPDSSGQYAEFWASADGKFNMPAIAPGTYRILAFDRPQPSLPYRAAEAMRAYDSQGQVVHLSAGQTQQVQVQLISGGD